MAKSSVIPFGPQHPVLPEPLHLDLVVEDEKVLKAIPQIGYVHRGLEKLVEKKDYNQFVYVVERICGICSFGHSMGYSETIERLANVEAPKRAQYLRAIMLELSRIHSHILWMGLAADAFGYESLFMHCWRLRERILDVFEKTTGGRVIMSVCAPGGMLRDIENGVLNEIKALLESIKGEYTKLCKAFLKDESVKNRTVGVGVISKEEAESFSMVGPFTRASGVTYDVRSLGNGAYGDLDNFEAVIDDQGDCYARMKVRAVEVFQSIDIINELVSKIPDGEVFEPMKMNLEKDVEVSNVLEQPRGECFYYGKGNGTKFLERFRIRTPTSQNLAGMVTSLEGCDLADVNMIVLTIDPCISCTER